PISLRCCAHRHPRPKPFAGPHGFYQRFVLRVLHGVLAGGAAGGGQSQRYPRAGACAALVGQYPGARAGGAGVVAVGAGVFVRR
nr:hypothetical protein [Tanacetum cinerariifolium]